MLSRHHKLSWIIVLLVIMLGGVVGITWWQITSHTGQSNIPSDTQPLPEVSKEKEYDNALVGIAFRYDPQFELLAGASTNHQVGDFLIGDASPIVTVRYATSSFADTNFYEGYMQLSLARPGLSAEDCQLGQFDGTTSTFAFSNPRKINDQTWYQASSSGAAAGTLERSLLYHTWHHQRCLEAVLTLFEGNIGNYTPGSIQPVDETQVFSGLDKIFSTVKVFDPTLSTSTLLYQFKDYHATSTPGLKIKSPDFKKNSKAQPFEDAYKQAVAMGPNFGGQYIVVGVSCGTRCQNHLIVNAKTGSIIAQDFISSYGLQFQLDSSLLIVNPPQSIAELAQSGDFVSDYYQITDQGLILLAKQKAGSSQSLICLQVSTKARNPISGEEKDFSSQCSVPAGWEIL